MSVGVEHRSTYLGPNCFHGGWPSREWVSEIINDLFMYYTFSHLICNWWLKFMCKIFMKRSSQNMKWITNRNAVNTGVCKAAVLTIFYLQHVIKSIQYGLKYVQKHLVVLQEKEQFRLVKWGCQWLSIIFQWLSLVKVHHVCVICSIYQHTTLFVRLSVHVHLLTSISLHVSYYIHFVNFLTPCKCIS